MDKSTVRKVGLFSLLLTEGWRDFEQLNFIALDFKWENTVWWKTAHVVSQHTVSYTFNDITEANTDTY